MNPPAKPRPRRAANHLARHPIAVSRGVRCVCVADNVSDERVSVDVDVESEDKVEVVGGSMRPMTSRQAVLASVVDSSHVALCQSLHQSPHPELIQPTAEYSRKKKQLTKSELAL